MSDLEPLTCIRCVRRVDPVGDDAECWVMVPHYVDRGDEHDDTQWVCADCATPQEVAAFMPPLEQLARMVEPMPRQRPGPPGYDDAA